MPNPSHISLCKSADIKWQELGLITWKAMKASDYSKTDDEGWCYTPSTDLYKKMVFWGNKANPEIHETKS